MKWSIKKEQHGMLVRDYLMSVRAFSRRILKAVKEEGRILRNGQDVTVRETVNQGDIIEVIFPEEKKGRNLEPIPVPLNIVYEDDDIIVMNKEAGIPVIPSNHYRGATIANGLIHHYEKLGLSYTVHIVTRLDKNTSGLMLIAKHRVSHAILAESQKKCQVKRTYMAFVSGHLLQKQGTIHLPIGRKPTSIIEREVRQDGQEATTHYELVKEERTFSILKVQLETGRTHQIRIHFAHIGHPLLGDDLYGGSVELIGRQALHCHELTFPHPFTGENLRFTVDYAEDMERLLI
ncbi:RluA family pseudouridine synthase [Salirhabdus salicampi]|uniref:RluA family pseudouridine synthase n=1 Tax=Salirhabdus salicampi TaxID=476102 RepID=UPI0020C49D91|nr:RluA family pseudouridine synthase [Salirhabdus salicampi]MCP8615594.1 RluA family pseudouridine synthase [Salirhabdus salicampi]